MGGLFSLQGHFETKKQRIPVMLRAMMMLRLIFVWVTAISPLACWGQSGSLVGDGVFGQARGLFVRDGVSIAPKPASSSLFSGHIDGSFFAPLPVVVRQADSSAVQRLRSIIGQAESPVAGYDAVQHGAVIKPRKRPTEMTIGEIFDWISATPGQSHAIGRYQFIPDTLTRVVAQVGARRSDQFSPAMQDRLADVLLDDAGFGAFLAGDLSQQRFMNNLASIWAGLPTSTGRSKYHGIAGNRATVTLAHFQSEITKIAP